MERTVLTETIVEEFLSNEISIASQDKKKLTVIPLHNEFRVYLNSKLKAILYAVDTAVDYYNHLRIKEYEDIATLCKKDISYEAAVLKTLRETQYNRYLFVEHQAVEDTKTSSKYVIKLYSVYRRVPANTNDFIRKIELNKTKLKEENKNC